MQKRSMLIIADLCWLGIICVSYAMQFRVLPQQSRCFQIQLNRDYRADEPLHHKLYFMQKSVTRRKL